MGLNTFDIKQAFRKLEEMMGEVNEDTGEFIYKEEDLAYFVNDLNEKKELKLNNIEDLKREYKARNEALEDKIKSLQSKVKQNDKTIDNLLFLQNVLLDGEKKKTDEYNSSKEEIDEAIEACGDTAFATG
jgi:chromosome segregation ATPase